MQVKQQFQQQLKELIAMSKQLGIPADKVLDGLKHGKSAKQVLAECRN